MKKIVIDRTLYTVKDKEFAELEYLVASFESAPRDEELGYYIQYVRSCETIILKNGEGKHIDGIYSING